VSSRASSATALPRASGCRRHRDRRAYKAFICGDDFGADEALHDAFMAKHKLAERAGGRRRLSLDDLIAEAAAAAWVKRRGMLFGV
jgi:hypothetical protein